MAAAPVTLELGDIQGLFARGYGIAERGVVPAARPRGRRRRAALARRCAGLVISGRRSAGSDGRSTSRSRAWGLRRLGLPATPLLQQFSNEFVAGMTTAAPPADPRATSAMRPGTVGLGRAGDRLHRLRAPALRARPRGSTAPRGAARACSRRAASRCSASSTPRTWTASSRSASATGSRSRFVEGLAKTGPAEPTVRAGEFVLGYPKTSTGTYTGRAAGRRTGIGRNGTYLVFRQLRAGRARVLAASSTRRDATPDGTSDPQRLRLASRWSGAGRAARRSRSSPDADDPALRRGQRLRLPRARSRAAPRCPVGSHIRRSNPRDSLDPRPGHGQVAGDQPPPPPLAARPRVRARAHAPTRRSTEPLAPDEERGLHFICLNGNIARQFEFVQHTWLNNPKFAGLYDDADPLVGPSAPYGGTFTIPTRGSESA